MNQSSNITSSSRRNFIRLTGGGTLAAATAAVTLGSTGCTSAGAYPAQAVEAWNGPVEAAGSDLRRWALAYAITAPNPHNLQPWLADLREANVITLFTDPTRVLPETDPFGRQILVGHGAFLELLVMALAEQGLAADVQLWPKGELQADLADWKTQAAQRPIARLQLSKAPVTKDPLFAQILKRHTPKSAYDVTRPVPADQLAALMAAAGPTVKTAGTADEARLAALRQLCIDSAMVEINTPATMMESIRLVRVGPSEILQHRDGISINTPFLRAINALGMFDRSAPPAPGSTAHKTAVDRFAEHSKTAMGFVWLSTPDNSRAQQVQAGRAYVRLQLKATELGLGVHPMSQALQEFRQMQPHYEQAHQLLLGRPAPKTQASTGDETLQMFCRVGYPTQAADATPRRPLSAFVQT